MVQVKVTEGFLEGELVNNEFGGQFCSFKGIPYAQPPVGDLRFKVPLAIIFFFSIQNLGYIFINFVKFACIYLTLIS